MSLIKKSESEGAHSAHAKKVMAKTAPATVTNADARREAAPPVCAPPVVLGEPEPEPELVREGALLLEPFDAPDVGAEPAEPELEPEGVMDAPTNPVGVGSCAKRSLDWKVTQFEDEGMRAVYGMEVIAPSVSGGWV